MLFLLLTLGPAVLFACGNIFEKDGISHIAKQTTFKTPVKFFKRIFQNFHWWCGISCSGLATIGYYIAMAKYDLSLVQPMMVLNPVLTALFGFWFLKEKLTKRIICAIVCVFLGLLLSSRNMGENSGEQNLGALWAFTLGIVLIAVVFSLLRHDKESSDSLIIGAGFGLSAAMYKSITMDISLETIGLETLKALLVDARAWAYAVIYTIAFIYSQVAFSRGRALFIIPCSAAVGAAVPILAGAFVFNEHFPPNKIVSVSLVLLGSVLFIVKRPRRHKKPEGTQEAP